MPRLVLILSLSLLSLASSAQAQTNNSYPMLMSLKPVAAQVGQTTEHEVSARYNLHGASQVIISGDGVIGTVVPPEVKPGEAPPATKPVLPKMKVRFTVAADAVPGVRDFRLVTPQGVSTVGQLAITRDPVVVDTGDNNSQEKAQAVTIPATVCGTIEAAEDVDWYKFTVAAGTSLSFHVRSQRLENRIHDLQAHSDPIITLRNSAGSTLAASDNYYAGDPVLFHKFDQAGEYALSIRDVRYQGNVDWVYSIEINARPYVTQVFPLAVAAGVESKLEAIGFNLPAGVSADVTVPAGAEPGVRWVAPTLAGQPVNGIPVVVTPLPIIAEVAGDNNVQAMAQPITIPATISGRIESAADIDCYTFEAKQGDVLTFEVIARRAQSPLDSNLRIYNATGGAIAEVDDLLVYRLNHADSWLENWGVPADGKYTIEIRDLHLRGGPEYTYVVSITRSQPYFLLEVDTDKTLLSPGTAAPAYVRVVRKNGYVGEVQLAVEGLPPGVTATTGRILAAGNDGCIILQAAPNAPLGVANIRFTGTGTHIQKDGTPLAVSAVARPMQEVYSPGGGRAHYAVEIHTVSVADPMDLRGVKLSGTEVSLKPGTAQKIEVTIERAPGFKGNVTLDVIYQHLEQPFGNSLPKGVTIDSANSKTLLVGEESKGFITLKAAMDAPPVEKQLVPLMAHVSVNFVMKMTYCGEPVWITVTPP